MLNVPSIRSRDTQAQDDWAPAYQPDTIQHFLQQTLSTIEGNLIVTPYDFVGAPIVVDGLATEVLERLYRIAEFHHRDQIRADAIGTSYMAHVLGVVAIYVDRCGIRNKEAIAAAFFHDLFEDSPLVRSDSDRHRVERDIREQLQDTDLNLDEVFRLTRALTKEPGIDISSEYLPGIWEAGIEATILKLADRIYNLRDLRNATEPERAQQYIFGKSEKDRGTIKAFQEHRMSQTGRPFLYSLPPQYRCVVNEFETAMLEAIRDAHQMGRLPIVESSADAIDTIQRVVFPLARDIAAEAHGRGYGAEEILCDSVVVSRHRRDPTRRFLLNQPVVVNEIKRIMLEHAEEAKIAMPRRFAVWIAAEELAQMQVVYDMSSSHDYDAPGVMWVSRKLNEVELHVSLGMLRYVRSEAELYFLIGHEMEEIRIRWSADNILLPQHSWWDRWDKEYQADEGALRRMIGKGYNPWDAVAVFERIDKGEPRKHFGPWGMLNWLLSSHPPQSRRSKKMREYIHRQGQSGPPAMDPPTPFPLRGQIRRLSPFVSIVESVRQGKFTGIAGQLERIFHHLVVEEGVHQREHPKDRARDLRESFDALIQELISSGRRIPQQEVAKLNRLMFQPTLRNGINSLIQDWIMVKEESLADWKRFADARQA